MANDVSKSNASYSFCESIHAGPLSFWHIREVPESMPLKFGGGIQTSALCGHPKAGQGWDLDVQISEHHLGHTCTKCVEAYREKVKT